MDEDAIEQTRRRDAVWQRPSWPLNGGKGNGGKANGGTAKSGPQARPFKDAFGFFAEEAAERQHRTGRCPPNSRQAKALRILELPPTARLAAVKPRYKALATLSTEERSVGR